jgi:hypothetical protein
MVSLMFDWRELDWPAGYVMYSGFSGGSMMHLIEPQARQTHHFTTSPFHR